jgi:hypothetical protein
VFETPPLLISEKMEDNATPDLAVPPPAAPGFSRYPQDLVRAIENPPGRGGSPIGITVRSDPARGGP